MTTTTEATKLVLAERRDGVLTGAEGARAFAEKRKPVWHGR